LEVLPYLERLRDELAMPMIYVSHAMHEVARLADHLVLLERVQQGSRVVATGPVGEVTSRLDLPLVETDDAAVVVRAKVVAHEPE
ncbi:molybdenum ABC transporter ATP-binding protein, partial [Acinetobacter baumannii]